MERARSNEESEGAGAAMVRVGMRRRWRIAGEWKVSGVVMRGE
jgi:hypothetical protein